MPAVMSMPPQTNRKRRVHAKSRKGCGNCKLRHVKVRSLAITVSTPTNRKQCDELRPHCKKCFPYGVECNYDALEANLQLSSHEFGTEQVIDFNADASVDRDARSPSYKTLPGAQIRGGTLISGCKTDTHN